MNDAFIAGAVRTPIGNFNGSLSQVPATRLGAIAIEESVKRSGVSFDSVDGVYMGSTLLSGQGASPARQAALGAGLPKSIRTVAVNNGCASSLQAVIFAFTEIFLGEAEIMIAGGMESVSRGPYLLDKARFGYRCGHGELIDSIIKDALWDPYNGVHIGESAEAVASKYNIGRVEQDHYAEKSWLKAREAQNKGAFDREVSPIMIQVGPDRFASLNQDEGPQKHETLRLSAMHPSFREGCTVTSGNSSSVSDGAAALVIASAKTVKRLGITPLARITGFAYSGTDPGMFSVAPADAINKLLKSKGLKVDDIDLFEINEDFAVSMLAVMKETGISPDKLNVNGGGIALGNPLGASGARALTTLLYAMSERGATRGVVSSSAAGGEAAALLVERIWSISEKYDS